MSALAAFVEHEARLQLRSLRFRIVSVAYLGACIAPLVAHVAVSRANGAPITGGALALLVEVFQPLPTAVIAAILAVDGITRERDEGSLVVLGLAPLTNAGYVLRRWFATQAIVLSLAAVPPLVAVVLSAFVGSTSASAGAYAWPFLVHVVPLSLTSSALALALGTIGGGLLMALAIGALAFGLPLTLGNDVLARFGRHLGGSGGWVGLDLLKEGRFGISSLVERLPSASDAAYDVGVLAGPSLAEATLAIAVAALALAIAPGFLHRTQPNVRPWAIPPVHPFRTFLRLRNRLREAAIPERGLTSTDRIHLATCLLVAAGVVGFHAVRAERYRHLAADVAATARSGAPEPTPRSLVPLRCEVAGRLLRSGEVRTRATWSFRNDDERPVSHLAFTLNPHVDVRSATLDDRRAPVVRRRERVALEAPAPIAPGAMATVSFELSGTPADDPLWFGDSGPRLGAIDAVLSARLSNQLPDFAVFLSPRHASPRRIELQASDLAPIPRYTSWAPVQVPRGEGYKGTVAAVPDEHARPWIEWAVDVEVPAGVVVADTCGAVAAESDHRLRGHCRAAAGDYRLVGAKLQGWPDAPPELRIVATMPGHAEAARRHVPMLTEVAHAAEAAWPGFKLGGRVAMLEWPVPFVPQRVVEPWWQGNEEVQVSTGPVLLVSEAALTSGQPLRASNVVASAMAASAIATSFLDRRRIVASEEYFFRRFVERLAWNRLRDQSDEGRAVLEGPRAKYAEVSLLGISSWNWGAWNCRLPALVAYLEHRVGSDRVVAGVSDFFAVRDTAGTAKEMMEAIGRRAGLDLGRFYDEIVAGSDLPRLTLSDVKFSRVAGRWAAEGFVSNEGTGQVDCDVVLRTDGEPVTAVVTVAGKSRTPFRLETSEVPRAVVMDPAGTCLRARPLKGVGIVEVVEAGALP